MRVFADTSALFALLVHDDDMHEHAKANFEYFMANQTQLLTSSYVLLETLTLLQRRVNQEAVWDFNHKIMPLLEVVWADSGLALQGRATTLRGRKETQRQPHRLSQF